jgi:hypothetical protein
MPDRPVNINGTPAGAVLLHLFHVSVCCSGDSLGCAAAMPRPRHGGPESGADVMRARSEQPIITEMLKKDACGATRSGRPSACRQEANRQRQTGETRGAAQQSGAKEETGESQGEGRHHDGADARQVESAKDRARQAAIKFRPRSALSGSWPEDSSSVGFLYRISFSLPNFLAPLRAP